MEGFFVQGRSRDRSLRTASATEDNQEMRRMGRVYRQEMVKSSSEKT